MDAGRTLRALQARPIDANAVERAIAAVKHADAAVALLERAHAQHARGKLLGLGGLAPDDALLVAKLVQEAAEASGLTWDAEAAEQHASVHASVLAPWHAFALSLLPTDRADLVDAASRLLGLCAAHHAPLLRSLVARACSELGGGAGAAGQDWAAVSVPPCTVLCRTLAMLACRTPAALFSAFAARVEAGSACHAALHALGMVVAQPQVPKHLLVRSDAWPALLAVMRSGTDLRCLAAAGWVVATTAPHAPDELQDRLPDVLLGVQRLLLAASWGGGTPGGEVEALAGGGAALPSQPPLQPQATLGSWAADVCERLLQITYALFPHSTLQYLRAACGSHQGAELASQLQPLLLRLRLVPELVTLHGPEAELTRGRWAGQSADALAASITQVLACDAADDVAADGACKAAGGAARDGESGDSVLSSVQGSDRGGRGGRGGKVMSTAPLTTPAAAALPRDVVQVLQQRVMHERTLRVLAERHTALLTARLRAEYGVQPDRRMLLAEARRISHTNAVLRTRVEELQQGLQQQQAAHEAELAIVRQRQVRQLTQRSELEDNIVLRAAWQRQQAQLLAAQAEAAELATRALVADAAAATAGAKAAQAELWRARAEELSAALHAWQEYHASRVRPAVEAALRERDRAIAQLSDRLTTAEHKAQEADVRAKAAEAAAKAAGAALATHSAREAAQARASDATAIAAASLLPLPTLRPPLHASVPATLPAGFTTAAPLPVAVVSAPALAMPSMSPSPPALSPLPSSSPSAATAATSSSLPTVAAAAAGAALTATPYSAATTHPGPSLLAQSPGAASTVANATPFAAGDGGGGSGTAAERVVQRSMREQVRSLRAALLRNHEVRRRLESELETRTRELQAENKLLQQRLAVAHEKLLLACAAGAAAAATPATTATAATVATPATAPTVTRRRTSASEPPEVMPVAPARTRSEMHPPGAASGAVTDSASLRPSRASTPVALAARNSGEGAAGAIASGDLAAIAAGFAAAAAAATAWMPAAAEGHDGLGPAPLLRTGSQGWGRARTFSGGSTCSAAALDHIGCSDRNTSPASLPSGSPPRMLTLARYKSPQAALPAHSPPGIMPAPAAAAGAGDDALVEAAVAAVAAGAATAERGGSPSAGVTLRPRMLSPAASRSAPVTPDTLFRDDLVHGTGVGGSSMSATRTGNNACGRDGIGEGVSDGGGDRGGATERGQQQQAARQWEDVQRMRSLQQAEAGGGRQGHRDTAASGGGGARARGLAWTWSPLARR